MATIASATLKGSNGPVAFTRTTLGASDTFTYVSGKGQFLLLENPTGGSLTVNIDGSGSTTISPDGLGKTIDVSTGLDIVLAAGAAKVVYTDSIAAYLKGTIAVTGASGATAAILI